MSKATLKQWWKYNKINTLLMVAWIALIVFYFATSHSFGLGDAIMMLIGGICIGVVLCNMTCTWLWRRTAYDFSDRLDEAASGEITVNIPRDIEFKDSTWRMARMSYAGIHAGHHDWKTWDQLTKEQQWALMAHVHAGSLMTLELAKRCNEPEEEA